MELSKLLQRLVEALDRLGIPYLVTGSVAVIAYGEPRLTNDIDVVVALPLDRIDEFCAIFPAPDYYCPREMVEDSVRARFPFNVLEPATGLKIDVMIATDSPFDRSRLSRGRRRPAAPTYDAWFVSPEDLILKKLEFYRDGGSDKHIRDILSVLKVRAGTLDRAYIDTWAAHLGVTAEWQVVLAQLPARASDP